MSDNRRYYSRRPTRSPSPPKPDASSSRPRSPKHHSFLDRRATQSPEGRIHSLTLDLSGRTKNSPPSSAHRLRPLSYSPEGRNRRSPYRRWSRSRSRSPTRRFHSPTTSFRRTSWGQTGSSRGRNRSRSPASCSPEPHRKMVSDLQSRRTERYRRDDTSWSWSPERWPSAPKSRSPTPVWESRWGMAGFDDIPPPPSGDMLCSGSRRSRSLSPSREQSRLPQPSRCSSALGRVSPPFSDRYIPRPFPSYIEIVLTCVHNFHLKGRVNSNFRRRRRRRWLSMHCALAKFLNEHGDLKSIQYKGKGKGDPEYDKNKTAYRRCSNHESDLERFWFPLSKRFKTVEEFLTYQWCIHGAYVDIDCEDYVRYTILTAKDLIRKMEALFDENIKRNVEYTVKDFIKLVETVHRWGVRVRTVRDCQGRNRLYELQFLFSRNIEDERWKPTPYPTTPASNPKKKFQV